MPHLEHVLQIVYSHIPYGLQIHDSRSTPLTTALGEPCVEHWKCKGKTSAVQKFHGVISRNVISLASGTQTSMYLGFTSSAIHKQYLLVYCFSYEKEKQTEENAGAVSGARNETSLPTIRGNGAEEMCAVEVCDVITKQKMSLAQDATRPSPFRQAYPRRHRRRIASCNVQLEVVKETVKF